MARQRHLPRAPITEALIDIQVSPREGLTFDGLRQAFEPADFGYYVKGSISEGTLGFTVLPGGRQAEASATAEEIGLRLHSGDERYVAQCRLTGFTLSRLPPYEDWGRLVAETKRLWTIYVERLVPGRVTRAAARYINNLRLPLAAGVSYQTYLEKLVDVPDGVPQAVAACFQRFQLVEASTGARVNLTLAVQESMNGGPMPVILDVDAFQLIQLDPKDPELWNFLEGLRALKNRCFFGSITERAAELYE